MRRLLPLVALSEKLTWGPPALNAVLDLYVDGEHMADFLGLVREYLPDREEYIWAGSITQRIERFAALFSRRYFPIEGRWAEPDDLTNIVDFIPIPLYGMSMQSYEEPEGWDPGDLLLLALVVSPYGVWKPDPEYRLPILDHARRMVGAEIASRIPPEGFNPEDLHRLTDGTKYDGMGGFADWVTSGTGCMMLDASYDEYTGEGWRRGLVDELTEQWPRVQAIMAKMSHLSRWVESAPGTNFSELLNYLLGNNVPKEQIRLPLKFRGRPKKRPETLMEIFTEEVIDNGETEDQTRLRPATHADLATLF